MTNPILIFFLRPRRILLAFAFLILIPALHTNVKPPQEILMNLFEQI